MDELLARENEARQKHEAEIAAEVARLKEADKRPTLDEFLEKYECAHIHVDPRWLKRELDIMEIRLRHKLSAQYRAEQEAFIEEGNYLETCSLRAIELEERLANEADATQF